jgi:signal transduction histidine kinase
VRRRLNLLVVAVTAFVVVVYTVPLALLVDRQADEAAKAGAERLVQSVASQVVEAVSSTQSTDLGALAGRLSVPVGVSVANDSGELIGDGAIGTDVAAEALRSGQAASGDRPDGGWELALPVITFDGTLVVQTVVPPATRDQGVGRAWAYLLALGVFVNGAAVVLADRLGRTLRDPVRQLADAAARLGGGDLDARVGMPEIEELGVVADALNRLAPQLRSLLTEEREMAADLSHRLRTPLAALRLQAEGLPPEDRGPMVGLVDRMQMSVDRLIEDVRRPGDAGVNRAVDIAGVAAAHAGFWSVLADEQGREFRWSVPEEPVRVALTESEAGDVIDTLIANVFAHTGPGTAFELSVGRAGSTARVAIRDEGEGFPTGIDPFLRGASGGGSTGLGLDIVKRLAESIGGAVRAFDAGPGASVEVELPLTEEGG